MNRTEAAFAAYLEAERLGVTSPEPTIRSWRFEPFRLRLGDDWKTSYTPDFQVVLSSGEMVLVEVKAAKRDKRTGRWMAYWQEGSTEKFKWARQHFPEFHFVAVRPYGKGEAPGVEVDVFGLLPNLPWVALKI
jgi:hypothetical protein